MVGAVVLALTGLLSGFFCNHRLPPEAAAVVALAAALEPFVSLKVASAVVVAVASVTATTTVTIQSEASSNSSSNNSGALVSN